MGKKDEKTTRRRQREEGKQDKEEAKERAQKRRPPKEDSKHKQKRKSKNKMRNKRARGAQTNPTEGANTEKQKREGHEHGGPEKKTTQRPRQQAQEGKRRRHARTGKKG